MVLSYLGLCATLFAVQRKLIYHPQPSALATPANTLKMLVGDTEIVVSTQAHNANDALLYFGGNAEDVSQRLPEFVRAFPKHAVYMLHYRGYGGSAGTPSEADIQRDALALFDRIHAQHPNIVVIGRSLGSGVAARLASQRPATKLILVTPYNSLETIAAMQYPYVPVKWLLIDKYESWRYAALIKVPTLCLVAANDEVIPRAHSEQLCRSFTPGIARLEILDGADHSSVLANARFFPAISDFIQH